MKGLYAALWTEILKVRRSKLLWISFVAFSLTGIIIGLMVLVSENPQLAGQSAIVGAKASLFKAEWPSYFELLTEIILTLGTIGFGIVSSWIFGREYSDRVIQDLLALPVPRSTIVLSKFIIIFFWNLLLSLTLFISGLLAGLIVNIADWSVGTACHYFIVFMGASLLTAILCPPVALIASYGRGYLPPIGFVLFTLIITQLIFVGIPIITPYVPWAVPALYSGIAGQDSPRPELISYLILASTCLVGLIGTVSMWCFADQN